MSGLLLFENVLDNAAYVAAHSVDAEQSGFEYQKMLDGRLDTAGKFTRITFDLQQADASQSSAEAAYTTNTETVVLLGVEDSQPFGYWVGYEFTLTSGPHAGLFRKITHFNAVTREATLEAPLPGSGTGTYTLIRTLDFNAFAIAGHNLSDNKTQSNDITLKTTDSLGSVQSSLALGKVVSNDVQVYPISGLDLRRYVEIEIPQDPSSYVSVMYLGSALTLSDEFDQFVIRPPFAPPGMMQTYERLGGRNNLGRPLPASYREEPFDVDLNFRHLTADTVRKEIARGMPELIQRNPFFVAWDTENYGYQSDYPEAAFCWMERTLDPPRLPDYNQRMDWRVRAKGLKR